jgi:hypothetical protein
MTASSFARNVAGDAAPGKRGRVVDENREHPRVARGTARIDARRMAEKPLDER